MRTLLLALALVALPAHAADLAARAKSVTIVRDDWGIAHVHGKTDADAVFGMVYAQAEDDFNRVEANYLTALGRTAEAEGEGAIWQDLRQKLFVDPVDLKAKYAASPAYLKAIMNGWADGLNYYLATHPTVHPRVLTRFEPWMALSFTEGSIGGDIEHVSTDGLAAFYGKVRAASAPIDFLAEPRGSNGIAIAPKNTRNGHALLLINPHTSFFFRSELQMTSDEGLNAYGAATWGQPFIYQGFNAHAGWMHTTSGVDSIDEFAETIVRKDGKLFYRYGGALRPVRSSVIAVPYRTATGIAERRFTVFRTHHGPIVREDGDKWIAVALMNKPVEALEQSFLRTKATDYANFAKIADRKANSSNNTLFADTRGEIAYLHPQFVPVRDSRFDYTRPVDGSDPATDWKGLHLAAQTPHAVDPKSGWVANTNDEPWAVAGLGTLRRADFPRYMDSAGPNPRGEHARAVLGGKRDFTPETLIAAAYDRWMPTFARLVPLLDTAWAKLPDGERKARLAAPVALLRGWDKRWSAASVETSLGVFWASELWQKSPPMDPAAPDEYDTRWAHMEALPDTVKLDALDHAMATLTRDFGGWRVPWGEINRYQRNDGAIAQTFDDAKPSVAVPFTSALWGSLASFGSKPYPGTKRWYGTSGNSFVAVVKFGPKVRALAVTAGGESGDPTSPHFADQAERYAGGRLREVYFYPEQLKGHTERTYRPGE